MYIGNFILLLLNLPFVPLFANILRIPKKILLPLVILFCITGMYSVNNSVFDIWVMLLFGGIGFMTGKGKFEGAPLLLGLVLGPANGGGLPTVPDDFAWRLQHVHGPSHLSGISPGDGPFSHYSHFSTRPQTAGEKEVRPKVRRRQAEKPAVGSDTHLCAETFKKEAFMLKRLSAVLFVLFWR